MTMTQISASVVKELREKTGAGMMDCKAALTETDGDMETAVDWLRKKGLAAAAKKAGRVAAEGLVGVSVADKVGAVVEVNAETDFVARNETFQEFVRRVAEVGLEHGADVDALGAAPYPGGDETVGDHLTDLIATVGENMALRRSAVLSVDSGIIASYVHNAVAPNLGKIGVLVALRSEAAGSALEELGKQLAMHVAAAAPQAVSRNDVDADNLERERSVLADQARASGKPEDIVEKMVEGRLRKYYEEVCLLDQTFVIDGETKVSKALETAAKDAGSPVVLAGFVRFVLGEGVEKKDEDFAAEVAAAAGG
jgi:elongation factor Ts